MLCPNRANGKSSEGVNSSVRVRANRGIWLTARSLKRLCRPGNSTERTSIVAGKLAGHFPNSELFPPAWGKQNNRRSGFGSRFIGQQLLDLLFAQLFQISQQRRHRRIVCLFQLAADDCSCQTLNRRLFEETAQRYLNSILRAHAGNDL